MQNTARQTRENRTITVDFQHEATYFQLLGDSKAFIEFVFAFILSCGFQLKHKAMCRGGGCLTRHSHYLRVRLGGVTIWRLQCTTCHAVFTVLPHFVLRYRQMRPEIARDALLATHGGLSLELCAVLYHISPMALSRLVCAFGHHSLVTVLTRCGLALPTYFLYGFFLAAIHTSVMLLSPPMQQRRLRCEKRCHALPKAPMSCSAA
jgi:hypothetical protein